MFLSSMFPSFTNSRNLVSTFYLCLIIAIYSMSGFFTKLSSSYDFLSTSYFYCLFGVVLVLALYAVLWQIALKRVPLNRAYLFRSLGLPYGMAIASLAFHEEISWQNLVGCAVVFCGLITLMIDE